VQYIPMPHIRGIHSSEPVHADAVM